MLNHFIGCKPVFVMRNVLCVVAPCGWVITSGRAEGMYRKRFSEEKSLNRKTGFDFLYNISPIHFSFKEEYIDRSVCNVPLIIVFKRDLNFLCRFSKTTQISNFMKIGPVPAEMFRADERPYRPDESSGILRMLLKILRSAPTAYLRVFYSDYFFIQH
jgi:hypothetical protein